MNHITTDRSNSRHFWSKSTQASVFNDLNIDLSLHQRMTHSTYTILIPKIIGILLIFAIVGCNRMVQPIEVTPIPGEERSQVITETVTSGNGAAIGVRSSELVIWLPEFLAPNLETAAGDVLATAYTQFEQMHPELRLEVHIKTEVGEANIYDYVRSARKVAPAIVPDIIVVDSRQLWRLVDSISIQPLDRSAIPELVDMYPFALNTATYKDEIYGIPYAADLLHMAYRKSIQQNVTATGQEQTAQEQQFSRKNLPTDWLTLLESENTYFFPANGENGFSNEMLLAQYVSAGGQLTINGTVSNQEALISLFNFLTLGRERNIIPSFNAEDSDLNTIWAAFSNEDIVLVSTSTSRYLDERERLENIEFAQIPTRSGAPIAIGHTWLFVILTEHSDRRLLALELIQTLLEPSIQGLWSQFAHRLPTQQRAITTWRSNQPYDEFIQRLLDVAVALPNGLAFADFASRLQLAQSAVLSGELTPQQATIQIQEGR